MSEFEPICPDGQHDRVYSDLHPQYASAIRGTANPLRCYWICRKCGLHGGVLFRCNHREFEKLVDKFNRNPPEGERWSVVDYAEDWLAKRPQRGNQVSTFFFALETVRAIRDDFEAEVKRQMRAQRLREAEESVEYNRRVDEAKRRASVVYFIRNVDTGLIKIGVTLDLSRRIKDLQRGGGSELEVLGSVPGDRELEAEFHDRWAALRVRSEWYSPGQDLLQWIAENAKRVELVA